MALALILFYFWFLTVPVWNWSWILFRNSMELGCVRDPKGYDKLVRVLSGL